MEPVLQIGFTPINANCPPQASFQEYGTQHLCTEDNSIIKWLILSIMLMHLWSSTSAPLTLQTNKFLNKLEPGSINFWKWHQPPCHLGVSWLIPGLLTWLSQMFNSFCMFLYICILSCRLIGPFLTFAAPLVPKLFFFNESNFIFKVVKIVRVDSTRIGGSSDSNRI